MASKESTLPKEVNYADEYIKTLTKDQILIIEIAKKQLGTSYDVKKSIGYLQFIKTFVI